MSMLNLTASAPSPMTTPVPAPAAKAPAVTTPAALPSSSRAARTFDGKPFAIANRRSLEAEQFQRLRHRLEDLAAESNVRVVAVTSALARDGKTMTAVNLAATLAQGRQSRTLLIDADLRRPNVAATLGLDAGAPGLLELVDAGGTGLERYVRRLNGTHLDVLPCELRPCDTYNVLSSKAFAALLAEARAAYQTIIIDTPPAIPVPDSSLLGRLVDGYLLVVSANNTPRKLVGETLAMLDQGKVLGLIFNRDDRPLFGYRDSYQAYFPHNSRK